MIITTKAACFIYLFLGFCFLSFPAIFAHCKNESPFLQGQRWRDEQGNQINAHGAGILAYNNKYYLYGEIKKGKTTLVTGQNWPDYRIPAGGVSCYSSADLKHWKYEGVALSPDTADLSNVLNITRVIERPKVIFNEKTKKFVMWLHLDKDDYSFAHVGVAVSNDPTGPFTFVSSFRPNGNMSRDMTIFKDSDNSAYLVYSSENNMAMHICKLNDDYLTTTKADKRIIVGMNREAPAMFKSRSKYYLITSKATGWSPNAALYATANKPFGNWKMIGNPCTGKNSETTYDSQSTFVLPLPDGKFLFMADRWNMKDLESSGYVWLPLITQGNGIKIKWQDSVSY